MQRSLVLVEITRWRLEENVWVPWGFYWSWFVIGVHYNVAAAIVGVEQGHEFLQHAVGDKGAGRTHVNPLNVVIQRGPDNKSYL